MLNDGQKYEAQLRKSSVLSASESVSCCGLDEGIESLICPQNWHPVIVPREFCDLARALRIERAAQ